MVNEKDKFLKILLDKKIVTPEEIDELKTMVAEGKDIEDILIERKIINFEKITELKAEVAGIAYQDISDLEISDDILNIIPFEVAKNYKIACFPELATKSRWA